jgi:hypothetical protein
MRKFLFAVALVVAIASAAFGQDAKAEQIMKQARAAIADESKWKSLQSLSASGTQRNTFGDQQMESELQFDLLFPDKIMRTTNGMRGTNINTLNGDVYWTENIAPVGGPGGGGFGGRGGFGGPGGPGGPGGAGAANNPMATYFQQGQRRDMLLVMLGFLLSAPASAQVQYTYIGEAPGPEGSKLDALNVKNANGLNVVLYLNQQTHQLVGIKYKIKQMRGFGGPAGGRGQGGQGGQGGGQRGQGAGQPGQPGAQPGQPGQQGQRIEMTPEERERRMKEAAEAFEKAPEVDFSWAFSDYKSVGGFNLPHIVTKSQGGTPNEEWTISKYKINPKLSADKFVKKEKAAQ